MFEGGFNFEFFTDFMGEYLKKIISLFEMLYNFLTTGKTEGNEEIPEVKED